MSKFSQQLQHIHGFYQVADQVYHNKLLAFSHAFSIGHFPHWNFHDDFFSKIPWNIEPVEDIETLYKQRAQQIRNDYDYIVVSYSGGIDSYTTAESFVKNGFKLDVLLNRGESASWSNMTDFSSKNLNLESVLTAYPQFKKLKEYQSDLEFKRIDWGSNLLNHWDQENLHIDQYNFFAANLLGKKYIHHHFPEIEKYYKPLLLLGLDKPQIYKIDGKYFITFVDERITSHAMQEIDMDLNNPFSCMSFYWHPDAEKILRKQVHLIVKWFNNHPEWSYLLNFPHRTVNGAKSNQRVNEYDEIVKHLIYPLWDPKTWQTDKAGYTFYVEEEYWFREKLNERIGVQKWKSITDDYSNFVFELFGHSGHLDMCKQDKLGNWLPPSCFSKLHQINI
jgi:hypothetical protein